VLSSNPFLVMAVSIETATEQLGQAVAVAAVAVAE
jgi:hypothetical protein